MTDMIKIFLMNINRLKTWLYEVWNWLKETTIWFMCCLVLFDSYLFGFHVWNSEMSVRVSGFVLQILGMIFAIHGLLKIRTHFGQSPYMKLFLAWMNRFPKWNRGTVINIKGALTSTAGCKANIDIWTLDDPGDRIELRIKGIIHNLNHLKKAQRINEEGIDTLHDELKEYKVETDQKQKEMKQQIHSDLESLHTDDISISLIGLIWLTVGISMSTMSQEIYKFWM
jgi:hypothetical protein